MTALASDLTVSTPVQCVVAEMRGRMIEVDSANATMVGRDVIVFELEVLERRV